MLGDPVFRLPPFTITSVAMPLSQTLPWSHGLLGIPEAWEKSRGAGIKVCVLDTGVDSVHRDLAGGIVESKDFTGSLNGPEDVNAHGTWCLGMIGGRDNEFGTVGIAPDCELYSGKVLGDEGYGDHQWIAQGIEWADEIGADIISLSLGSMRESPVVSSAIDRFVRPGGRVVVAAAGNDGNANPRSINWPGAHPRTVAVAAIDKSGNVANFSSRGPQVDICAPGVDLLSTVPNSRYATMSGTSMATPVVAGVVALMMGAGERDNIPQRLRDTAIDVGDPGQDNASGYGLVNPDDLLSDSSGVIDDDDFTLNTPIGELVFRPSIRTDDGNSWMGVRFG